MVADAGGPFGQQGADSLPESGRMRPQVRLPLQAGDAFGLNLERGAKGRNLQRLLGEAGCQMLECRRS